LLPRSKMEIWISRLRKRVLIRKSFFCHVRDDMSDFCNATNRWKSEQVNFETGGSFSHWRKMLCVSDVRLRMHQSETVVLSSTTGTQCWLRLLEWTALKTIIPQLIQKYPVLATMEPRTHQLDHQNLRDNYCAWNVIHFNLTNCCILHWCDCIHTNRLVWEYLS
jgi:hypothetical protein